MSKVKRRIIDAAIELYNLHGVRKITTRHIAANLSISAGNLHYHFKHTEDIVKTIFNDLAGEYADLLHALEHQYEFNMTLLADFILVSFRIINRYRFIFLHFVEITIWIPDIKILYHDLAVKREKQVLNFLKRMSAQGSFRNDLSEHDWSIIVQQIYVISDFWLSSNEINKQLKGIEAEKSYMDVMLSVFKPYII
ncbi:TetR/AcrR family transcriptional regulator [Sphingobacterium bambusae]|uniref:TetR/AcrR family transcriptional regulator n=1 Tax=Sphingobacterium bambusae TaxID=662858 RepID=A0ABW6BHH4_9SPHI|nr:TetR/AcrR family transcriptional regulator [Sphingobacterium bambusae]WPL49479.1 TetR/AcrR family transcriptional regulator [Sphingobacterium bambusae]